MTLDDQFDINVHNSNRKFATNPYVQKKAPLVCFSLTDGAKYTCTSGHYTIGGDLVRNKSTVSSTAIANANLNANLNDANANMNANANLNATVGASNFMSKTLNSIGAFFKSLV
jgi:hypothetical protein